MSGINIFPLEMFAGETNKPWRGIFNLRECLGSICYCRQIPSLTWIVDSCEQIREEQGFFFILNQRHERGDR